MARKRSISVRTPKRHDDAESLRRHLARAGFKAEVYVENPIDLSSDQVRAILVHVMSITDGALGALLAAFVLWALARRKALPEKSEGHTLRVNVEDARARALDITVSGKTVKFDLDVGLAPARRTKKTVRAPGGAKPPSLKRKAKPRRRQDRTPKKRGPSSAVY